jgi:hypothetical protein
MKNVLRGVFVLLAFAAAAASASELPSEFTYIIYVEGQQIGISKSKVTETADAFVIESHTEITSDPLMLEIDSRTVLDKTTLLPREFYYEGQKQVKKIDGSVVIEENQASCTTGEDVEQYAATRVSRHPQILILEEYVMAHEVAIAAAFKKTGLTRAEFGLLYPSIAKMTTVTVIKSSELAFESETKEAYCEKIVVAVQGSSPFASYFDPERNLPLYIAFPGSFTEVFLDEFFDGKPVSRFRPDVRRPAPTQGDEPPE